MLASCLRGKARSVLEGISDFGNLPYHELLSRLELRFGESNSSQGYYAQFTSRRQNPGEDLPSLGADLERLARLAYPECAPNIRDKIACSQFVTALSDGFVKRTLQLEGLTSLRAAIERSKTIKLIKENSSWNSKEGNKNKFESANKQNRFWKNRDESRFQNSEKGNKGKPKNFGEKNELFKKEKECWQCGSKGHFRSECPSLSTGGKGNLD